MNEQTPPPSDSLPPLGASAPAGGSTPPPPPPPMPPEVAETAEVTDATPEGRPRTSLLIALAASLVVALVGALAFVVGGGDDSADAVTDAPTPISAAPSTTVAGPVASIPMATTVPSTVAPTTEAPTTTAAPTTTEAPPTTEAGPSFPTLPDGSPEPILAIYDGPVIRVSGWAPSQEKADQLYALAIANSTDPNAVIDGTLQIDPLVPLSIGTRVIEMNSPRFPPGSSEVTPEHALQLDRVAGVMNLLPGVTATVVGHADQVGDAAANYVLSEARAVSVVRYLVGKGVDPARLSSRAVGEQDLLSEEESEASLALNRRTEFVFYGLIAD